MFFVWLWRWLRGWVRLEAEGGFPERLLNLAVRQHLPLWNTRRKGIVLSACCFASDYRKLRPLMRKTGMRMRVKERHGVPFFLRRYRGRWGIPVGIAVFFMVISLLSGRIWSVDVVGIQKADKEAILTELARMGVKIGSKIDDLNLQEIQLNALKQLDDISWLAVNLEGSIARVEIRETDEDRITPPVKTAPSNLKARCDGVILSTSVTSGQAMVKPGEAVVKGTLLISGVVELGEGKGVIFRRATGVILAETKHTLEVSVPLKQQQLLPTGKDIFRPSVRLFGLLIPLYTNQKIETDYMSRLMDRPLTINGVALPIGYTLERIVPLQLQTVTYTEEQAKAMAEEQLKQREQEELSKAEIKDKYIEAGVKDGCYTIRAVYRCVEDIGEEEPILIEGQPPA